MVAQLLDRERAIVHSDDGFDLEYAVKKLVRVEGGNLSQLNRISEHDARMIASDDRGEERMAAKYKGAVPQTKATGKRSRDAANSMEIDLHLHEIIEIQRGMSDGEKLEYQLGYFERMLNTAIKEKKERLVVIHGVGAGVLREEVRKLLAHYPGVRFEDADPGRYGFGATEVRILRH